MSAPLTLALVLAAHLAPEGATHPSEPATAPASEPSADLAEAESAPPAADEPAPLPAAAPPAEPAPAPARKPAGPKRPAGRGLTIAGGVLTGLGVAGRLGIDVFLATVADLRPSEPYGTWSVGAFFMATSFSNVPTLTGIGLLGAGAYRRGHWDGQRGRTPSRARARLGWGLLGGGLGLWGLSRALFFPWVNVCQTNGCAYGYLETTYYASAGLAIAGLTMVTREAGLRRADDEREAGYIRITPLFGPSQGLALSGRF